jgi:cystathionine beta-synthase
MKGRVYSNIVEAIGQTPLVKLNKVTAGVKAEVYAKIEYVNPGGSIKDRIALTMINEAEKSGKLKPGGTIVEPTSGNTGAGLAMIAAMRGYRAIFTMPDKMSHEKVRMLKAYGAEVVICPTAVPPDSPENYHRVAEKIAHETPNAIMPDQYQNPKNPEAHYLTTGPEIWEQTEGKIDYLVCGVGTGGTISGLGRFFKEKNPAIKIVGADPHGSVLRDFFYTKNLIQGQPYKVEGIGQDSVPATLDYSVIDEMYTVGDKESFAMSRRLAREEGMLVGGSCGSAAAVAVKVARDLPAGKLMIVILPDTGKYYLSKFYSDEWMKENRFLDVENALVKDLLAGKSNSLPKLVFVHPTATVREALAMMEHNNVSQLPVIQDSQSLGSIEESALMGRVLDDTNILDMPVQKVMDASFPEVHHDDTVEHTKFLLARRHPAILVRENDKYIGIITKADLIDFIA